MGSVSSSSALSGSVDSDVVNGEVLEVFSVGVRLQVVDQSQHDSDGLFWPSTEGFAELSGLTGSSDTTEVLKIWYASSVSEDVLEVLFGFGDGETLDGVGGFVGVFIMNSEVLGGGSGN